MLGKVAGNQFAVKTMYQFVTKRVIQMTVRSIVLAISAMFIVSFGVATAKADTVLIDATHNNGSFESPLIATPDGSYHESVATPTGWNGLADIQVAGTASPWNITASDGFQQIALAGYSGISYVGLNITDQFQANTTYRLDMDASANYGASATATVTLADVGGVYRMDVPVTSTAAPSGTTMTWAPIPTIVLNTADNPDWVGLGINVGIWNPRTDVQFWADNVRLVASPNTIPEPGTFLLTAIGLIGLLAYAWRKRR
jgi:hypothetical protein